MKKYSLATVFLVVGSLLFAAGDGEGTSSDGPQLSAPGTFPIVGEPYSADNPYRFSAVAYYSSTTSTGTTDDMWFADYIAEKTNIRIDFTKHF